jgi:RimJ/RimL family protein N-acetyltransferase
MNYLGMVCVEAFRALMQKHPGADRWSFFILERNVNVHKFFKYLGFHIEKIATESKNKAVDYFQEFTIKKKELTTVLAALAK